MSLEEVANRIRTCHLCPLAKGRSNAVPGEGNPKAEILIVGEAPGAEEDRQGRPFVGPAGKVLMEALEAAGLKREDVFITNVVKCRPPHNREPHPSERAACRPYLEEQIALIEPKVIALLGRVAVKEFLGKEGLSGLRSKIIKKGGRLYFVTYHPAAAIYNPGLKETFMRDLARLTEQVKGLTKVKEGPGLEEFM